MKINKNFGMYISGKFISQIGTGIQAIALPIYILDLTGSGTLMGLLSMFSLLPALMASPFAGIIGDRKNRRNIMIGADCVRALLVIILTLLAISKHLNIYIIFTLQIFICIMDSFFYASSSAIMPDIIPKEELIEASSMRGGFDAASTIIGPILGGLIYGLFGIKVIFLINAISFILSAILSTFITYNKKVLLNEKITAKSFIIKNSEVLKYIVNRKGLFQLFTFAMIANLLLAPLFDVIMPFILKKKIGFTSQQYGLIMSSLAVGVLLGNIAIFVYFKKWSLKKLMSSGFIIETTLRVIVCVIVFPFIVKLFGGATWLLFASISFLCIAMEFFNAFVNTSISTNLQHLVPSEMRSRFFSILGMFSQGAIPLGSLLFGILLDIMKYYHILIIINFIVIVVVTIFLAKACDEAYEAKV